MKHYYPFQIIKTVVVCLLFAGTINAQKVGINTESVPNDAVLSVNGLVGSSYKGMVPPKMTTTQRNSIGASTDGLTIYNTTDKAHQVYSSGIGWQSIGVPKGAIIMWSGSVATIPEGWNLCNGVGGTPDLRNRFIVGGGSVTYSPGDTGGASSVTLTTAQMPTHRHGAGTLEADSDGAHDHELGVRSIGLTACGGFGQPACVNMVDGSQDDDGIVTEDDGAHSHNISGNTGNAGSGNSHENRPPYYALAFIIKK